MSRTLVEGVDFDAMGPVLYQDPLVTVVASGGIPVYTAVGYTDDIGFMIDEKLICGPGNGLKTFDRLYQENQIPSLTPKMIETLSKRYNQLTKENVQLMNTRNPSRIDLLPEEYWLFNQTPKEKRAAERNKYLYSGVRRPRIKRDPAYGSHIYIRAPSTWPHELAGAGITLKENCKGTEFNDFHMKETINSLFAGAEGGAETSNLGVVVRVDPNKTFVYNSNMRVNDHITGEIIKKAGILLSEYLLQLKEKGIGFIEPEFELYATPPDGLLKSDTFSECVIRKKGNDFILKSPSGAIREYKHHEIKPLKDLYNKGIEEYSDRSFQLREILDFFYYIGDFIEYLNDLGKIPLAPIPDVELPDVSHLIPENTPAIKRKTVIKQAQDQIIKKMNVYILKIHAESAQIRKTIKSVIYPLIIKSFGVLTEEDISQIKSILVLEDKLPEGWQTSNGIITLQYGDKSPLSLNKEFHEELFEFIKDNIHDLIDKPNKKVENQLLDRTTIGHILSFLDSILIKVKGIPNHPILGYLEEVMQRTGKRGTPATAAKGQGAAAGGHGGGRRKTYRVSRTSRKGRKSSRKNRH